jgi:hypothetical protein
VSVFFCGLCVGVIIGLIFGPDSEREHAAKVDGWISGFRFARQHRATQETNSE